MSVPASGDRPLVSVVMIAHNLERYIAQAIDSVLAQQAPFAVELLIGEDCSTDDTRAIVEDYARRFPEIVRPLLRPVNLGMNRNFFATFAAARGAYVALLDGDDYWTASDKLATQVSYLESHRGCALCFHNVTVEYDDGTTSHPFHMTKPTARLSTCLPAATSGVKELAGGNFIQTASVMYRGGVVDTLPAWVFEMPTFDWPLHLLHAEAGTVEYLDRTMAVYRVHRGGMWSSNLSHYRTVPDVDSMLHALSRVDDHLGGRCRDSMAPAIAYLHSRAMEVAVRDRDYLTASRYAPLVARHAFRHGRLLGSARAAATWARGRLTRAGKAGSGPPAPRQDGMGPMGVGSAPEPASDLGVRLDAARLALQRVQIARNRRAMEDRDVLALLRKAAGVSWWHVREWWRLQAPDAAAAGAAVTPPAPYLVRQRYPAQPGRARVLHLIANFVTGGSSRLVVDLVEQLGHRFDQTVVTAMSPRPADYEGIGVAECTTFASVEAARAMVEAQRPDLVHVHYVADADSPYGVSDFHWYCRLFDALEHAGPDRPWRVVQNVNIPVPPYISPSVDRYVYVSDYVRDRFGLQTAPALTVYPGSDLERFGPAGTPEMVPDDTIGMVYRLERDKLDDRAIEPFIRVVAMRPHTRALVVGAGTYLAAYREAVRHAGLQGSFTFTGEVAYEALPALIRRMAVFVAPVHTESFGQVSSFAMGLGRPVAGYAVGALPEITGDLSVLAPPGDAVGLAGILVGLLDDRERRLRLGAANRQRALDRFSVEAMALAYERLYDTLLATGVRRP